VSANLATARILNWTQKSPSDVTYADLESYVKRVWDGVAHAKMAVKSSAGPFMAATMTRPDSAPSKTQLVTQIAYIHNGGTKPVILAQAATGYPVELWLFYAQIVQTEDDLTV
jgi:hypothetical protein